MYVYKMYFLLIFVGLINYVLSGPAADSYKDQYCTDPRTMKKHAAYSEWADAYSCTKHRCQPGGRNLAIYTVGCKRVEAPESAIECEEVVEDTNIQFPYCCTRLRCLVVVRGEVWTRVLGQPWETLPAAPWSHMYKMKKPPPPDITFLPKDAENGPIYELTEPEKDNQDKNLRSMKTDCQDSNKEVSRAASVPDIVIALSTDNDEKNFKKADKQRHLRSHHNPSSDNDELLENELSDVDSVLTTEKPQDVKSEEITNSENTSHKTKTPQLRWTEVVQNILTDHDSGHDTNINKDASFNEPDYIIHEKEKPSNLQSLVDAIGNRMRDIENVIQRMSENVHQKPVEHDFGSEEREMRSQISDSKVQKHKSADKETEKESDVNKPGLEGQRKRFLIKNRAGKYLHTSDGTGPPVTEDNRNDYFNDPSNSIVRTPNPPKEPAAMYMAPVVSRRKEPAHIVVSDSGEKKKKKKHHKKRRGKVHGHKKHRKDEKKKTRTGSNEVEKNVSVENDSAVANQNQ